jgi:hypothetical protein
MNESNKDRYVIACIRIPMKIFENGKYEMQKNLANIQFEDCNQLPEKGNLDECNLSSIFEKFYVNETNDPTINETINDISNNEINDNANNNNNTLHEPTIEIQQMYVLKTEIVNKNHKHVKNNTFKHKMKDSLNRFSRKTRE